MLRMQGVADQQPRCPAPPRNTATRAAGKTATTAGQASRKQGKRKQRRLTSWIGKHAHERRQLRWAPSVRNVQPATSRPMNAAGGMLLGSLLLRLLLLLLHGGQANGSGKVHVGCGLLVSDAGGGFGDGIAVRSAVVVVVILVFVVKVRLLETVAGPRGQGQILPKEGRCRGFKRARQSQGALERKESGRQCKADGK